MQAPFTDAIQAARDELDIEIAVSPSQVLEAQRIRYQIYCEERGFEHGSNGLEQDEFDARSRHVLVRSRETGLLLGTVRVVLSNTGMDGFPMRRACEPWVLRLLPMASTGEVSRFALARGRSGVSPAAAALMRLCLVRGIVQISAEHKLTHLCAIMEHTFLRLLRATGIHFLSVGPVVEHHGARQPAVCGIDTMLHRMRIEQPPVWAYITGNGALWTEAPQSSRFQSR